MGDKKRCFFIGPIGDPDTPQRRHSDMVLNNIVREALPDFVVHRADELHSGDMITKEIIGAIFDYEMAVADMTFHNPNVFYELALRHMKQMPIVHIAAMGTRIPFDTAGHKAIFFDVADYNSHVKARADIKEAVEARLAKGYKVSNPVTQARAELKLAESSDPKDVMLQNLASRIEALEDNNNRRAALARALVPPTDLHNPSYLATLTQPGANALANFDKKTIGEFLLDARMRAVKEQGQVRDAVNYLMAEQKKRSTDEDGDD